MKDRPLAPRARGFARARHQLAWTTHAANRPIWDLSKRELAEISLHLASRLSGEDDADTALKNGAAYAVVREEARALKRAGLI